MTIGKEDRRIIFNGTTPEVLQFRCVARKTEAFVTNFSATSAVYLKRNRFSSVYYSLFSIFSQEDPLYSNRYPQKHAKVERGVSLKNANSSKYCSIEIWNILRVPRSFVGPVVPVTSVSHTRTAIFKGTQTVSLNRPIKPKESFLKTPTGFHV